MSADISPCGKYRYTLHRKIKEEYDNAVIFIMLNPSTADAEQDDPTIRRCKGFAERLGFSDLYVLNLFAYRATKPSDLYQAHDPVGPDFDKYFKQVVDNVVHNGDNNGEVVCAWGTNGSYWSRDIYIMNKLRTLGVPNPKALLLTKDGHPQHPLYIKYGTPLIPYRKQNR